MVATRNRMHGPGRTSRLTLTLLVLSGWIAACQKPVPPPPLPAPVVTPEKFTAEAIAAVDARRQFINRELVKLGPRHPWAGHYYLGDGLGVNARLSLAPVSGFSFTWHGNLGLYDHNYGNVSMVGQRLFLTCEMPNEQKGLRGLATEFWPVSWGERQYLIDWSQMPAFCNAINSGREPRTSVHGAFFLRGEDNTRPAPGRPRLPEQYRDYLRDQPLEAVITEVHTPRVEVGGELPRRTIAVTLNVGRAQGAWLGMELHTLDVLGVETATVSRVEEQACEAVFLLIGQTSTMPQVGWKLSTRLPFLSPP